MNSTHELLYKSTRELHRTLDQSSVLTRLLSPDLTRDQYILALSSLYQAIKQVELALEQYEKPLLPVNSFRYQHRADFLATDLTSLGIELSPTDLGATPTISTTADYLGVCYVLEGASLGSAHIARYIESQHPEFSRLAFRYWAFQQKHVENWPIFLSKLASLDSDASLQKKAIDSATTIFEIFIEQMHDNSNAKWHY